MPASLRSKAPGETRAADRPVSAARGGCSGLNLRTLSLWRYSECHGTAHQMQTTQEGKKRRTSSLGVPETFQKQACAGHRRRCREPRPSRVVEGQATTVRLRSTFDHDGHELRKRRSPFRLLTIVVYTNCAGLRLGRRWFVHTIIHSARSTYHHVYPQPVSGGYRFLSRGTEVEGWITGREATVVRIMLLDRLAGSTVFQPPQVRK